MFFKSKKEDFLTEKDNFVESVKNTASYNWNWLLELAIVFFVLIIFIVCGFWLFEKNHQYKIYQGVWLGDYDLSNKTVDEAKQLINQQIDKISQTGINFSYQDNEANIQSVIHFDVDQTLKQAISFGRNNNLFTNFKNIIITGLYKKKISIIVNLDQQKIEKNLRENFLRFEQPAQDATLVVDQNSSLDNIQIKVKKEKLGKIIDYQKGINELADELSQLKIQSIKLLTKTQYPLFYAKNCLNAEVEANAILSLVPITFEYDKLNWIINKNQLADWLLLKNNLDKSNSEKIIVSLDKEKVKEFLIEKVAFKIDQTPSNAKFQFQDNKVVEFQTGADGVKLNIEATYNNVENYIKNKSEKIDLVVEKQSGDINIDNINDFGIKEIIGTGESNFAGSPINRRHNIKIGVNAVSGILIKPDEEFSLIKTLGKIEKSTGYLPELVIKQGKTIPEYGGGLCQIGTTIFRSALASGLPITMRYSHAYRVQYYEPAGTDATIYDSTPDLKFINDTGNYILIQSRIEGNKLFFDFWGTKDGRIVTKTKPIIYNIVKPSPTKIIETLDLPVGEKKCTEHAHNGADAYFDYKVVYPNNEIKNKRFSSHYVPWQEVCLIGVKEFTLKQ